MKFAFLKSRFALFAIGFFFLFIGGLISYFSTSSKWSASPVSAQYNYELRSEGSVQISPEPSDANLQIETFLSGTAQIEILPERQISLRWRPSLQFTVNGRRLMEQEALLQAVGEQRMVLLLSQEGLPEKIYFQSLPTLPPEAAELVVNTGKMLLLQLAWNQKDPKRNVGIDYWGSNNRVWTEENKKFQTQTVSYPKTQSGIRGRGTFTMAFDANGFLESLNGSQQTSPDPNLRLGQSLTTYQISRQSLEKLDQTSTLDLAGLVEDVPWIVVNSKAMMRATLEQRTKGWDLNRVVSETNTLIQSKKTSARELLAISTKIQELLWLRPELAEELVQLASKLGTDHPLFDEILKALTWVGDDSSQKALQKILEQNKSDESAAIRTMVGLAFVDNPSLESQQALEALASNPPTPMLGRTAELMLGQMAHQLLDTDINRAEEIQSRYVQQLHSPQSSAQIRHALNVIGNSGVCKDYGTIEQYVNHSDPEIHSRALEALRFCQDSRVASLILKSFAKSDEEKQLVVKILEMRAQRQIYDSEIFQALLRWLRESGSSHALAKPVVGLLGQLARLDATASSQFAELRTECDRIGICSYF